jgi:release factor glutamine methyltransferase
MGVTDRPGVEAELLWSHALGVSRTQLLILTDDRLDSTRVADAEALIARRAAGEPFAYLTGRRGFWTFDVTVTPAVLIPRPETEHLLEWSLELLPAAIPRRVLDLGTGSGVLALAIALERPNARVVASDASLDAIDVAAGNAAALAPGRIDFHQGDWFAALPDDGGFDLIVANPPYIADADPHLAALRFEPPGALVAGPDGLRDLRRIINDAPGFLHAGGTLLLEHGADQAAAVRNCLAERGFSTIATRQDYAGLDRVSGGCWHGRAGETG